MKAPVALLKTPMVKKTVEQFYESGHKCATFALIALAPTESDEWADRWNHLAVVITCKECDLAAVVVLDNKVDRYVSMIMAK